MYIWNKKRVFGRRRTNSTNKERSGARLSTTDLLTSERCVEYVTPRDGACGSTTIHIFLLSVNMTPPNLSTRKKHSRWLKLPLRTVHSHILSRNRIMTPLWRPSHNNWKYRWVKGDESSSRSKMLPIPYDKELSRWEKEREHESSCRSYQRKFTEIDRKLQYRIYYYLELWLWKYIYLLV